MNSMKADSRNSPKLLLAGLAIAIAGTLAGALLQRYVLWPDQRDFDLVRVAWAVDFNNRLHMLRLLRKCNAPSNVVREAEISTVALLDTIKVEHVSPTDESYSVVKRVVQSLRQYVREFPNSEFAATRHESVKNALEKFPDNPSN